VIGQNPVIHSRVRTYPGASCGWQWSLEDIILLSRLHFITRQELLKQGFIFQAAMQYEMFFWTITKTSESKEEHIGDSRKESKWNVDEQEKMSDVWPHASLKAQMVTPKGAVQVITREWWSARPLCRQIMLLDSGAHFLHSQPLTVSIMP